MPPADTRESVARRITSTAGTRPVLSDVADYTSRRRAMLENWNRPCWCGSGKPYHVCHLNRGTQPRLTREQILAPVKTMKLSGGCQHPAAPADCKGKVVSSHTIQRSRILETIGENGQVLTCRGHPIHWHRHGEFEPQLVGLAIASTFPGYCEHHDKVTFAPLEDRQFVPTKLQAFLLGYRSLVQELVSKEHYIAMLRTLFAETDRGTSPENQAWVQANRVELEKGAIKGMKDISDSLNWCDAALQKGAFDEFSFWMIQFPIQAPVVASAFVSVEFDFCGKRLQNWRDFESSLHGVFVNLIPHGPGSACLFGWHNQAKSVATALWQSLISYDGQVLSDLVTRFLFTTTDNVYCRPSWWAGLQARQRSALRDLMGSSISVGSSPADYLPNRLKLLDLGKPALTEVK